MKAYCRYAMRVYSIEENIALGTFALGLLGAIVATISAFVARDHIAMVLSGFGWMVFGFGLLCIRAE